MDTNSFMTVYELWSQAKRTYNKCVCVRAHRDQFNRWPTKQTVVKWKQPSGVSHPQPTLTGPRPSRWKRKLGGLFNGFSRWLDTTRAAEHLCAPRRPFRWETRLFKDVDQFYRLYFNISTEVKAEIRVTVTCFSQLIRLDRRRRLARFYICKTFISPNEDKNDFNTLIKTTSKYGGLVRDHAI